MKRSFCVYCLAVLVSLAPSLTAYAAILCVGPTATGNGSGSDWNNLKAWSGTPSRGDTWYLVDGDYSGKTFNVVNSGATLITIKKATVANHGGISEGWNDTLGDGQAAFSGALNFNSSYWVFDGQFGGGPGDWDGTYGFQVTETGASAAALRIGFGGTAGNVTLRHIKTVGMANSGSNGGATGNDAVALYGSGGNNTISYVWTSGAGRCPFYFAPSQGTDGQTNIIEYCRVTEFCYGSATHSEVASIDSSESDVVFRYNLIQWSDSTGGIMWGDGTDGNPLHPDATLRVYGNVFYMDDEVDGRGNGTAVGTWTSGIMHHVAIHDNTFIGVPGPLFADMGGDSTDINIKNNLFYNCGSVGFIGTHNYNHFISSGGTYSESNATSGSGNPFVSLDLTSSGFAKLSANTTAGTDLGVGYNTDMYGTTRTTWTRGAVEYVDGRAGPVLNVSPSNLNFGTLLTNTTRDLVIIVQNVGSATLAGTATGLVPPFSIVSGGAYSLGAGQSQNVTVRFSPSAAASYLQNIIFTGGGGATAPVSASGILASANTPPSVSAIAQNAADVDPIAPGIQVYEGTVVQYSASASDPDGGVITWQWIHTVNGGSEVVYQSGSGSVTPASFVYGSGTAGRTYVWKLRASDDLAASESQLTVSVIAPPTVGLGVVIEAESGAITSPFVGSGGVISQPSTTDLASGGRATYSFVVTNAGEYAIQAYVNGSSLTENSLYMNIDAEPQDPAMAWDILPPTSGFEYRIVSWRGSGTADANEVVPKYFALTQGTHQLIIRGREANTQLDRFIIFKRTAAPTNLRTLASSEP